MQIASYNIQYKVLFILIDCASTVHKTTVLLTSLPIFDAKTMCYVAGIDLNCD